MGRPPVIPAEKKTQIVLSVLSGEVSIAEAARKERVSETSISRWKAEFVEAGKTSTWSARPTPSGPSSTPFAHTRHWPGTGPWRSTRASPTRRSPSFSGQKSCQLLDAGHSEAIAVWNIHYNYHRPHSAAGGKPPATRLTTGVTNVQPSYT